MESLSKFVLNIRALWKIWFDRKTRKSIARANYEIEHGLTKPWKNESSD